MENFGGKNFGGEFGELLNNLPKFNPPKVYCNIPVVLQITHVIAIITKSLLVI